MENKPQVQPYIYPGQTTLASGSTGQLQFQVASNFDFIMTGFSYVSSINSVGLIPTFDIQFLKNEHAIFFDYVPNDVFCGRMYETSTTPDTIYSIGLALWFKFDKPYRFEAKSNIIVNLRNTSGAANTIKISIGGYKLVYSM